MSNQAFTKVNEIAAPISDLTISNNLRVGGTTIAGLIEKTLIIPTATAVPSDSPNNIIQITSQQSGTTFILTQNDDPFNQVFVLPPAAIGLNYTFIVQNAVDGSTISIMPYGYNVTDGNPATSGGTDTNGSKEAFANGIQAVICIGDATAGSGGAGDVSDQINTANGGGAGTVTGGIMFTTGMLTSAMLKLTCISTSVTGAILTGCRWVGTGQGGNPEDIGVSA